MGKKKNFEHFRRWNACAFRIFMFSKYNREIQGGFYEKMKHP
jgi:hypothetical protein